MRLVFKLLIISVLFTSCAGKFGKVLKSKDNEYKYRMAERYYNKKEYTKAQQLYDGLMTYMRGTTRYEEMFFKYAYTSYYVKDYTNAEMLFKTYTETFPAGKYLEEASFMRGKCFWLTSPRVELDQTPTRKCLSVMMEFVVNNPESAHVKDAQEIIQKCNAKLEEKDYRSCKLYFDLEQYKSAVLYFNLLMDDYPESKKMDFYYLSEIKSELEYAKKSTFAKRPERYKKVMTDCSDFSNRFAESKYLASVEELKNNANHALKSLNNE